MSRIEFATIIAYIGSGCGKQLSDAATDVYFDLLHDLPLKALRIAAKRAILEHKYATFPPVAIIRQFAVDAAHCAADLSAGDAWEIVMRCMAKIDVAYQDEHKAAILSEIPPLAMQAAKQFGLMALYNLPNGSIETARAQFRSIYESVVARNQSVRLLPDSLKSQIKELEIEASLPHKKPARITQIAARIGRVPE